MYMDLFLLNEGVLGCGLLLVVGLVLVIELMLIFGIIKMVVFDDKWMVMIVDGLCVVYWEYIVVVIDDGF